MLSSRKDQCITYNKILSFFATVYRSMRHKCICRAAYIFVAYCMRVQGVQPINQARSASISTRLVENEVALSMKNLGDGIPHVYFRFHTTSEV